MILWNTAAKMIEGQHAGKIFEFAPNERKKIYDPDVYNHLFFAMEKYGLVLLNLEFTPDEEKKALIKGLKARWKTKDAIVRNYQAVNKAHKSKDMPETPPSDNVIDASEEASEILAQLRELEGDRLKKVESYLKDDKTQKAIKNIEESEEGVVITEGHFETKLKGDRPGRSRAASSRNS